MKKYFLIFILIAGILSVKAQDDVNATSTSVGVTEQNNKAGSSFLSHLSIALRSSTLGGGIQAATPINDYFNLRAGLDFMSFKTSDIDITLEDPDGTFRQALGYMPDYRMKGKLNLTHGNVLVDFYPTKGIFHLTAGFFVGTTKIKADGILVDNQGNKVQLEDGQWPTVHFDGHQLEIDDANLNAELQLGKVIKPYFGLGLGRAIANKRVSFKFELGALYQGNYTLKQNGKKLDINKNVSENFDDIDTYTRLLKWWPMLNFQISYKIF